jgi:hypothetical protein
VIQNFQPGTHPDADQLSVFAEGATAAWERERMLAHLAECVACREAVFLMQEPAPATARPQAKEWIWRRWVMPAGLAGALLACGLAAVLVYIGPHRSAPESGRQNAGVRQPEIPRNKRIAAPVDNAVTAAGHEKPKSRSARAAAPSNPVAPNAEMSKPSEQTATPSIGSVQITEMPRSGRNITQLQGLSAGMNANAAAPSSPVTPNAEANQPSAQAAPPSVSAKAVEQMPLNGRNVVNLLQLSTPADTKAAASQQNLAEKEALPALKVERTGGQDEALSGVAGRVTDPTGAIVPGATVALRDATGKINQTKSSIDGSFSLTNLPPGHYDLTAEAKGFKRYKQPIDLKPSEVAKLETKLDIGAVSESVMVVSEAPMLQTDSASLGQVIAELPSSLPAAATVSLGKRMLSLDSSGNLFLSRNAGRKWKKIDPQWVGKAVSIELATADTSQAPSKRQDKASGAAGALTVFQLTTGAGAVWTSEDGARWRRK